MVRAVVHPMETTVAAEDCELLNEFARAGKSSAFERVMERHAGWVFAVAMRQLRDVQLAEDATQNVFLLLAQKAKSLGKHGHISGWLFETVQNTVRNIQRARRRREWHERRAARESSPGTDAAEFEELLGRVDAAVECLDEEDRIAVVLRFHRGFDYEKVAANLGTTEAAARKRVGRAVARLRRMLGARIDESMLAGLTAWGTHAMPGGLAGSAACNGILLMATAKSKAAMVGLLAMLFLVGGGITAIWIARSFLHDTKPSIVPEAAAPATRPGQEDFAAYYGLQPGEYIKRVMPDLVPKSVRLAMYSQLNPVQAKDIPRGPEGMSVPWSDGRPGAGIVAFGNGGDDMLPRVMQKLLNISEADIEGDASIFHTRGDISYLRGATEEQYLSSLEKVVAGAGHPGIRLSIRTIDKKVIVFSGTWNYTPVDDPTVARATGPQYQPVLVYSQMPVGKTLSFSNAPLQFMDGLEKLMPPEYQIPVVFEGAKMPARMRWIISRESQVDGNAVLDHIAEQTGLTWKEEVRGVRCLVVEKG